MIHRHRFYCACEVSEVQGGGGGRKAISVCILKGLLELQGEWGEI